MAAALNNADICSEISAILPGRVSLPGQEAYDTSKSSYFFQEARLSPLCIVFPRNTAEVALLVKELAARHSGDSSPSLVAIRGGGHTPFSGAANINNGVTIDLSHLDSVDFATKDNADPGLNHPETGPESGHPSNFSTELPEDETEVEDFEAFTVSVGGGARWGRVYAKLQPSNVTAVGGRASSLGVGGLLTGGGISFLSPRKGFACDNIVNMEVVLADGSIVNANARHNPDLFKALKGGSNNYGIVTRFDLLAFAQGNMWGGFMLFPPSTVPQQLSAFSSFMRGAKSDPYGSVICAIGYVGIFEKVIVSVGLHYTKAISNPAVLQPFTSIQPQLQNSMRIAKNLEFVDEVESLQPRSPRGIYVNTVFRHTDSMVAEVHQLWSSTLESVKGIPGIAYFLIFQRFPRIRPGRNSLGLDGAATEDPLVLCLLSVTWAQAQDDPTIKAATRSLVDRIDQATKAAGLFQAFKYLNYAANFQEPISSYGPATYEFLQDVSRKYDPTGFFQTGVPGGFKLFR